MYCYTITVHEHTILYNIIQTRGLRVLENKR